MSQNYFLKISKFLIYLAPFSLIVVFSGDFPFYVDTLFPFIVGKYSFFRTTILLALVFFIWAWARGELEREILRTDYKDARPHEKPSRKQLAKAVFSPLMSPLALAVAAFVLIFLISSFLSYNPQAAFWSNFERGEGGLQLLCLFIFFALLNIIFRDEKSWRRLFIVMLSVAILVFLYGIIADAGTPGFIGDTQPTFLGNLCHRFGGSLGNAAYVGTFMIFVLFYAAYLLVKNREKGSRWIYLGAAILSFIVLILSQTRGALLGLGAAVLLGLIYLFFSASQKRTKKITALVFIVLLVAGVLAVYFRNKIDVMPFCGAEGGNRIIDISTSAETYQTRLVLWGVAFNAFKDHPILGWGPEDFAPAFEKHYDPRLPAWYDRAHDIFLDYLVITGIIGLLSFLSIFFIYYFRFFKKSGAVNGTMGAEIKEQRLLGHDIASLNKALFFALPVAYLVQGIVLFDVLPTYLNLFLFLAFANFAFANKDFKFQ